jgi:hypothetical protein
MTAKIYQFPERPPIPGWAFVVASHITDLGDGPEDIPRYCPTPELSSPVAAAMAMQAGELLVASEGSRLILGAFGRAS